MSYNKINYNNFIKILKIVFEDTNIRHDENFLFILSLNHSIYGDNYMDYIEFSRDIILLAALKTIIEEYDFLITKIDNKTLLYSKKNSLTNCIITSKFNNIDTLYNYFKYLNSEYNRIVKDMEDNLYSLFVNYNIIENDKSLFLKKEMDKLIQQHNIDINNSFYKQHLYFCIKFMLCNLSCVKLPENIDKDLVIQRNIHHLFYIFDNNISSNIQKKFFTNYKNKFNNYILNYCKANNLLDDNNEIKYIVVEDFLINDFFKIIYFDKKINDFYEGCYLQLNGNKTARRTLDNLNNIIKNKDIETVNLIVDS